MTDNEKIGRKIYEQLKENLRICTDKIEKLELIKNKYNSNPTNSKIILIDLINTKIKVKKYEYK